MLVFLYVIAFIYSVSGLIFGIIIAAQDEWPHATNTFKTVIAFLAFGPFFWAVFVIFITFMSISEWLTKK